MAEDPEQLGLFDRAIPWEDATVEAQEAKEAETPAQKKARRQEENRQIVLNELMIAGHPLSTFEVSERLRVKRVDIKPEQVRAAMSALWNDSRVVRRSGDRDELSPPEFDLRRYTPR